MKNDDPEYLEELLSAYFDSELTDEQRADVEMMIGGDERLRESLGEIKALSAMMKRLPRETLDDSFADRVLMKAEQEMLIGKVTSQAETDSAATKPRRFWWVPAALAALLTGVLLLPSMLPKKNDVAHAPEAAKPLAAREADAGDDPDANEPALSAETDADSMVAMGEEVSETAQPLRSDIELRSRDETDATPPLIEMADASASSPGPEREEGISAGAALMAADDPSFEALDPTADASLVEVRLPAPFAAAFGGELDVAETDRRDLDSSAVDNDEDDDAGSLPLREQNRLLEIGNLYAVEGTPEEISELLVGLQNGGAIIEEHDVPQALRTELLAEDKVRSRWAAQHSRKQSAYGLNISDGENLDASKRSLFENAQRYQAAQQFVQDPRQELTVLEPNDSAQLALICEQNAITKKAKRRKQTPWIQNLEAQNQISQRQIRARAGGRAEAAPARSAMQQEAGPLTTEEFQQRLNEQLQRRIGQNALRKERKDQEQERSQVYLWLRCEPTDEE